MNIFVLEGKRPRIPLANCFSDPWVEGEDDGEGWGKGALAWEETWGTGIWARQTWTGIPEYSRVDPGQVTLPFQYWCFLFVKRRKLSLSFKTVPTSEDGFNKTACLKYLAQSKANHKH